VLQVEEGRFAYTDATGAVMTGDRRLALRAVVLGGRLWHEVPPERASAAAPDRG
jgi:hypothetical protein